MLNLRHCLTRCYPLMLICTAVPFEAFGQQTEFPGPERLGLGRDGELSFGLYYGEADRLSASVGVTVLGLFGTDERLDFGASFGRRYTALSIKLTDPDFYEGPYERRLSLAIRSVEPGAIGAGEYAYGEVVAGIAFGRRVTDVMALSFGAGISNYKMEDTTALPVYIDTYTTAVGDDFTDYYVYGDLSWDWVTQSDWKHEWQRSGTELTLDTQIGSTEGTAYGSLGVGVAHYLPLSDWGELRAHGALRIADTLSSGPYPIFRTFVGGGPGTLRGFAENSLGPRSDVPGSSEPAYPGGQLAVFGGIEARAPLGGRDDLFGLVYLDMGNVYARAGDFSGGSLRAAVGIGVEWKSRIGPISVFLSAPILSEPWDDTSRLQFTFGYRM
jgi:outer membrane protein insertion porin family